MIQSGYHNVMNGTCNIGRYFVCGNWQVMSELQAAIEFQVELGKFYNVDLFQRG